MLSICDILPVERIFVRASWRSKKRVFEQVSIACENAGAAARDKIFSALMERERLGSTYIGLGGAIPHGRMSELKAPTAALVLLEQPIQYDGDDSPARTLFFLLVPPSAQESHLLLLGMFSEILSDNALIEELHAAPDAAAVVARLAAWEKSRDENE